MLLLCAAIKDIELRVHVLKELQVAMSQESLQKRLSLTLFLIPACDTKRQLK